MQRVAREAFGLQPRASFDRQESGASHNSASSGYAMQVYRYCTDRGLYLRLFSVCELAKPKQSKSRNDSGIDNFWANVYLVSLFFNRRTSAPVCALENSPVIALVHTRFEGSITSILRNAGRRGAFQNPVAQFFSARLSPTGSIPSLLLRRRP
jgi:hypothetical protein